MRIRWGFLENVISYLLFLLRDDPILLQILINKNKSICILLNHEYIKTSSWYAVIIRINISIIIWNDNICHNLNDLFKEIIKQI